LLKGRLLRRFKKRAEQCEAVRFNFLFLDAADNPPETL